MTTLVLLPGLDGTGELFAPFVRELPSEWHTRVVAYPADARQGYDELVQWAQAALPVDGPLVLLGESFSGPIAIRLAAALGTRVQALVLCCTFARSPRPGLSWLAAFLGWLPSPAVLPSALPAYALLGRQASTEARALLAQVLAGLPADVVRARLRMVMQVNVLAQLGSLRVPVLYLQAGQDRVLPRSAGAEVLAALPSTRLIRLDGPHGLLQAAPRPAAAAIASFLAVES